MPVEEGHYAPRSRHAVRQSFLDGVDAWRAYPAGPAAQRCMAKPCHVHDGTPAFCFGLTADPQLVDPEQREAEVTEQPVLGGVGMPGVDADAPEAARMLEFHDE